MRLLKFTKNDERPSWLRNVTILPDCVLYVVLRKTKDKKTCYKCFQLTNTLLEHKQDSRSILVYEIKRTRKILWDNIEHYHQTGDEIKCKTE